MSFRRWITYCLLSILLLLLIVTIAYICSIPGAECMTIEKNLRHIAEITPPNPTLAAPEETDTPVPTQTTVAPITSAQPSDETPFMSLVLIVAALVVLSAGRFLARCCSGTMTDKNKFGERI